MKTISRFLMSGMLIVAITMAATVGAFSDDKPKGKPWNPPSEAPKNIKNPKANDAKDGKVLYEKNCKSCHGISGKGDGPKSANLEISAGDFTSKEFKAQTDGTIFWKITEGRKPMPSFKEKLNDNDRWLITSYTRSLK